jgi:two-component system CheB/CheR fusion protein
MWTPVRSVLVRYSMVPVVVVLALLTRCLLLGGEMPFLLLWPAVMLCAWYGGVGPGLLATGLSAAVTACLFVAAPHWFGPAKAADWTGMALFVFLGSTLSLLCESLRRARLQVEQYTQDLHQRAEELTVADQRKNEFLALLAHELRNPLAPIRNAVQIMKLRGVTDPQVQWARDLVERQVRQMTRLIDDLLDISRISRGKITLRKELVEVAAVVHRAVETTRPLIDERRHSLRLSVPSEPVFLDADPTRLEQVLANLLNNAAKYTDPGGEIVVLVELERDEVVVRIQDTGIGIVPEMLPHIFEMFVQAESGRGGLGIGLSLVQRLVQMHGGSITASSGGSGLGSEFVLRLPRRNLAPVAAPPPPVSDTRLPERPVRVLVVDDNRDAAESLAALLRLDHHEVEVAYDGVSGLAAAEKQRPEVILLDLGMPGMDGYEVARRLREQGFLQETVVVAVTGRSQEKDRRRSEELGFDGHLVKPVDPEALHALLAKSRRAATVS